MSDEFFDEMIIDPQMIDDALSSTSRLLTIPERAAKKGSPEKPNGGTAFWTEVFDITEVKTYPDEKTPGSIVYEINFTIPAEIDPENKNNGKSVRMWYRVNRLALNDPKHDKFKGSRFNLGRLLALLGALGMDVRNLPAGTNFTQYFKGGEDGTAAWVVGKRLKGINKRSWYEGKPKDELVEVMQFENE